MAKKILIVDDDRDLVESLAQVLQGQGLRRGGGVSAAPTGLQALLAERPDLVILDVMMETDTAGFEAADQIRSRRPSVPLPASSGTSRIVILTAIDQVTNSRFSLDPGDSFLPGVERVPDQARRHRRAAGQDRPRSCHDPIPRSGRTSASSWSSACCPIVVLLGILSLIIGINIINTNVVREAYATPSATTLAATTELYEEEVQKRSRIVEYLAKTAEIVRATADRDRPLPLRQAGPDQDRVRLRHRQRRQPRRHDPRPGQQLRGLGRQRGPLPVHPVGPAQPQGRPRAPGVLGYENIRQRGAATWPSGRSSRSSRRRWPAAGDSPVEDRALVMKTAAPDLRRRPDDRHPLRRGPAEQQRPSSSTASSGSSSRRSGSTAARSGRRPSSWATSG